MTGRVRRGEPQVLSSFDRARPKTPMGIVARAIQMTKRKFQSSKSRRATAFREPTASSRMSRQK